MALVPVLSCFYSSIPRSCSNQLNSSRLAMGFFKTCWEILAYLGLFGQLGDRHNALQIPLQDHHPTPSVAEVANPPNDYTIVGKTYPDTPFTCSYPSLQAQGWLFCNDETQRSCWLTNPQETQPLWSQYDINTDYEKIVPKGIEREVCENSSLLRAALTSS